MSLIDWLKKKAKEVLYKLGEGTVYAVDKTLETISGGRVDIWDDSLYSWNRQKQTQEAQIDKQTEEVINNYLNILKQQGLYKGENLQQVKKTSSGGIISPKDAGVTVYEVDTASGTKLVRVDYSKGTVEVFDKETGKQESDINISGTIKKTYWKISRDTYEEIYGTKSSKEENVLIEVDKDIASIANKNVRKVILKTTHDNTLETFASYIPFVGQAYRAVETSCAMKELQKILKQNEEAYYDVYRASKYLQDKKLQQLGKETAFHAAAIATSALAGEVLGSTLAGKAASQTGKLATLRVGAALSTAGAAENVITDIAYSTIAEGRNPTKKELIESAILGAASAGALGTLINRLALKQSKWSKRLLRASYLLDPYEKPGDLIGEELKRTLRIRTPTVTILPTTTLTSTIPSPSPAPSSTQTTTSTYTNTPSLSPTPSTTSTPTTSPTITPTPTPTLTSTPTPSTTASVTSTPSPTKSPTPTPTPSQTPTQTLTPTPIPLPFRKPRKRLLLFGVMPIPPAANFNNKIKAKGTRSTYYNELKAARIFIRKLFGL